MKRDFITLSDFSAETLVKILNLADRLKREHKNSVPHRLLEGKTLGMIFAKSSTRTRVSFEAGMYQLGGLALFLSNQEIQLGRGETIADTARVLSRYLDAIMIRNDSHNEMLELARHSSIPVISGLSERFHPCQAMADMQTIRELKGDFHGLKLAYVGDGNNVAHSLLNACSILGMDCAVASPEEYQVDPVVLRHVRELAAESGSEITITTSPEEAAAAADVIYTDTWISMGQESLKREKVPVFKHYQVNRRLMDLADKEAVFMHCLPAYTGYEVTSEIFESPQSVVFEQAENRLHVQKAIMLYCILGEACF